MPVTTKKTYKTVTILKRKGNFKILTYTVLALCQVNETNKNIATKAIVFFIKVRTTEQDIKYET